MKVSAVTVPEDIALTWSSDNTDSTVVDQEGNVTGLEWWTSAKISASFEYEGETYSDNVTVHVRDYDLEAEVTQNSAWGDDSYYLAKMYLNNERSAYIEHVGNGGMFNDGAVRPVYNPDGTSSSVYAQIITAPTIVYDETKDYYLEVYYKTNAAAQYTLELLGGILARDGWDSRWVIPSGDEDVVYLPLKQGTRDDRNCGFNLRAIEPSQTASAVIGLAIVSKPKA